MDRDYILSFVYKNQQKENFVSWGTLENRFVRKSKKDRDNRQKCAKQSFVNYMKEFKAEGKLEKKFNEKGKPVYFVPEKFHPYVEGVLKCTRTEFHELINSVDTRWLDPLRNMIHMILKEHMRERHEDPYDVFNSFCFVFMGEMPFAFGKVPGALTEHIAFENRLRKRHHQDIEKFEEEFFRTRVEDAEGRNECLNAWVKELGGTITEYYRKLKKKAEKMPFPQSMWMVMGYSDEEIEKMLAEEEEQYARMQKQKRES